MRYNYKPMIFDIHTHTNLSSCSGNDIHEMIGIAKTIGLDGICITDHQTMDIRHQITEGPQENGVAVIFGMEYDTLGGDFLIFGPYEDIEKDMNAEDLLKHVNGTGGIAIAAHPFRKDRPTKESLVQKGLVTIIESINGRNLDIENMKADKWKKQYKMSEVGGSDAHTPQELGRVITRFSMPIRSRKDFIYALSHDKYQPEWRTQQKSALSY
jgi:predicted metal-dependent phosphoesterase TrpH